MDPDLGPEQAVDEATEAIRLDGSRGWKLGAAGSEQEEVGLDLLTLRVGRLEVLAAIAHGATAGFGEHFIHGLGHHLGLETHDVGDIHVPLKAGAVITVEPGVYSEDETSGVRIEDDVAITDAGRRVLSEAIPKAAEAVERQLTGRTLDADGGWRRLGREFAQSIASELRKLGYVDSEDPAPDEPGADEDL